jgi:hypothetical protein
MKEIIITILSGFLLAVAILYSIDKTVSVNGYKTGCIFERNCQ